MDRLTIVTKQEALYVIFVDLRGIQTHHKVSWSCYAFWWPRCAWIERRYYGHFQKTFTWIQFGKDGFLGSDGASVNSGKNSGLLSYFQKSFLGYHSSGVSFISCLEKNHECFPIIHSQMVTEETEANAEDGEPLYQNVKAHYYSREKFIKQFIKNSCVEIVDNIINCYEKSFGNLLQAKLIEL